MIMHAPTAVRRGASAKMACSRWGSVATFQFAARAASAPCSSELILLVSGPVERQARFVYEIGSAKSGTPDAFSASGVALGGIVGLSIRQWRELAISAR